jgi:hypothetical protein
MFRVTDAVLSDNYQRFGGAHCLHFRSRSVTLNMETASFSDNLITIYDTAQHSLLCY